MNKSVKKDRKKVQTEQQFIYLLMNIIESYPQYEIPQHLCHILRKKNDDEEAYYWSSEKFLKKVEDYYDELNSELSQQTTEE